jgi:aminoglycoside phosphotransferase (APT) family kinase protein
MERMPGRSMMEDLFGSPAMQRGVADLLAQTQAELHAIPSESVAKAMEKAGIDLRAVTLAGQFDDLQRYVADNTLAHLKPGVAWLEEHRPPERDRVAICHGDFHPGNVMVDAGQMTGILDWSGAQLADPEYDVAVSLILVAVAAPELAKDMLQDAFRVFSDRYLTIYSRFGALDSERLRYYRAFRAMRAFIRASAVRTPHVNPRLLPRDQYPWARPGPVRRLMGEIKETTGITMPLPRGVDSA